MQLVGARTDIDAMAGIENMIAVAMAAIEVATEATAEVVAEVAAKVIGTIVEAIAGTIF